jgi:hypothetical protein
MIASIESGEVASAAENGREEHERAASGNLQVKKLQVKFSVAFC